ncbi:hypothetical protein EVAR_73099_1 [Eumeta japonica]|uniref:Uncharacterized protein n=1 Tax=Eumeta variegata TaxID=151549 RepID=A0A4C1SXP8_EUMVA|nr:hypothetical protein EVAR_73099_1 [Eumeta japonica]
MAYVPPRKLFRVLLAKSEYPLPRNQIARQYTSPDTDSLAAVTVVFGLDIAYALDAVKRSVASAAADRTGGRPVREFALGSAAGLIGQFAADGRDAGRRGRGYRDAYSHETTN